MHYHCNQYIAHRKEKLWPKKIDISRNLDIGMDIARPGNFDIDIENKIQKNWLILKPKY